MSSLAKWYVVQVYTGFESRVDQVIKEESEKRGLLDKIEKIYIPTEKVLEIKNGTKVEKVKNYFPGYLFIKMQMDNNLLYVIRNINKVSGFIGMNGDPTPISEEEIQKIINKTKEASENPRNAIKFEVGNQVRVSDGPFASFSGTIEEIDEDKQKVKVSVMIFGRATPVNLEFDQIERI